MIAFDDLNRNQRAAADWGEGPLLVLAGPGSGKTLVLTLRVVRLIEETPKKKFRVLGLTFTNAAADEMRQRVADRLGSDAHRPRLTTFHAYAINVLRQHGGRMGLHPSLTVLTEDKERLVVLRKALEKTDGGRSRQWSERGLLRKLEVVMATGDDPELGELTGSEAWFSPTYAAYLDLLATHNCVDFGSSLILCRRLFRKRPIFARDQRTIYPYVCVDEYQDVNRAQDRLLRTVYPDRDANLFVVADDDQTIYEWNGASPMRLRGLTAAYDMRVIQLPRSFRCPEPVIRLANVLMRHDRERAFDKQPLEAVMGEEPTPDVRVRPFADEAQEARWIAEDIGRRADPGACAVLARSRRLVDVVATALGAAEVSSHVAETRSHFESPLLRVVWAVLRLAETPAHSEHLVTLCQAYGELAGSELEPGVVEAESALTGKSLLETFVEMAESAGGAGCRAVVEAIRRHVLASLRYERFAAAAFKGATEGDGDGGHDGDSVNQAWEIRAWEVLDRQIRLAAGERPALARFLQELDSRPKARPVGDDEVRCLTIHGAKGLEFEHVYVVGLAQGELPSYRSLDRGEDAIREERRACFVAITRASGSLTMTYARKYFGWAREASQFLREMAVAGGVAVGSAGRGADDGVDVGLGDRVAEGP